MAKEFILIYKIPLLFGVAGLVLIVTSFILASQSAKKTSQLEFYTQESTSSASLENSIVVDIAGAVERPDLYTLPFGTRVGDLLERAGGLTKDADVVWFDKTINRAQILSDGYKLYVPRAGEVTQSSSVSTLGSSVISIINLNTASKEELESLPGIGDKTAEKIISGRPYGSPQELKEKNIVGDSVFEKIKDSVSAP